MFDAGQDDESISPQAVYENVEGLGRRSFPEADHLLRGVAPAWSSRWWDAAGEAGWFRLGLPEEDGGAGAGWQHLGAMFFAFGQQLLPGPLLAQAVLIPALVRNGLTAAATLADAALDGQVAVTLAQGPTPPWGQGREQVRVTPDAVHGTLDLVAHGGQADVFLVVAASQAGPCLLRCDQESPALVIDRQPAFADDADYASLAFDGRLDPADVLVAGAEAKALLDEVDSAARLMAAYEIAGVAHMLIERTVAYAKLRHQFGRPIGSFQVIKHMLANTYAQSTALATMCQELSRAADQGDATLGHAGDVCLAFASRAGRRIAETCLQIHGGIGFTAESYVHLCLKRVLRLQGAYGDGPSIEQSLGASLLSA
jgi:alkylation response protein AidB-like acyl-CoA dehydrogenase